MIESFLNLIQFLVQKAEFVISIFVHLGYRVMMYVLNFFFGWIRIPSFPAEWWEHINSFFELIFNNLGLLNFFIPLNIVIVMINIVNFELGFLVSYKILMWIIRKFPVNIN